ncbi:imidazolonepropionase [Halostella sp. JP-L12]|uniref:imidazolonepropionase n=1 Tax=Halostella TaxID=1843185 RepID=UPI000EF780CB|nr:MULTISPECIES: imidazolonepropionase [Halostella]NHN46681.1 imidazolonepropionase [Halostella sp. JP-L12]
MTASEIDAVVYDAREVVVGPSESGTDGTLETREVAEPTASARALTLDVRENAAVAIADGHVVRVGDTEEVTREYPPENAERAIDAAGQAVVPGFVDPHTHAVFAGDRSDEFAAKLRGRTYQEILAEGGGILRTVRATREASDETLLANLVGHLDAMLDHGTTTVEVKSGYGLDRETELRLLEAIERADERHPVDVVPTFMGAHAVPEDRDADDYVDAVVDEQIPAVAEQGVAEFCDVFCEEDVFSVEQSRRVLDAGADTGLTPKVHAEEFVRLGGAQLAADVDAASADHLLHATEEDARALAESGVVPVLLPGTAFGLGADYADPAPFREAGSPVALATDFNPNCFSRSQAFAATLGCVEMGMTPAEALVGVTHAAALALSRNDGTGTLREGAPGDLVVLDAPSHVHVPYRFDGSPVGAVLKEGVVVRE